MNTLDYIAAAALLPLAVLMLFSGLDDLVLVFAMLLQWLRHLRSRTAGTRNDILWREREKRIAIFVPLWHEQGVIYRMLEHNLAAIRYTDYDFFVGVYPNDEPTLEAVHKAAQRYANVHLAVCPHDGPTSKADCLNWIYQRMLWFEEEQQVRFEIVVTHDAEDLIHPESLQSINHHAGSYDMVQVPVLPLATPPWKITHGVYCDEFAEYQAKDVPLRTVLGGFLPSNGVGTGYTRRAIEALAESSSNRIFEPGCLTEDYENGLRLHRMGFRQVFVPLRFQAGQPMATREYFPHTFRQAVRQRTRWVTGITLQSWERHGWRGSPAVRYWFWRDRKGLLGHPVSVIGNAIFLYGLVTWFWSSATGQSWGLGTAVNDPCLLSLTVITAFLQAIAIMVRMGCSARVYGWRFAVLTPIRTVWANWINCIATSLAAFRYAQARLRHIPLVWVKTEHLYPSQATLRDLRLADNDVASAGPSPAGSRVPA